MRYPTLSWVLLPLVFSACQKLESSEPGHKNLRDASPSVSADENSRDCVDDYDPTVDYFPEKGTPRFAERFSVDYFPHYKKVTVTLLDGELFQYLLYQCGTPRPEVDGATHLIRIPVQTVATTSTAELPHIVELGLIDRLVGHDEFDYVSSPEIRRRIAEGALTEIGDESRLNFEVLVDLAPELVFAITLGSFEGGLFDQVQQAGIQVVHNPSYLEARPLGRAEWILFTSLFFNREARAIEILSDVASRYEDLTARGRGASSRPAVLLGAPIGDTWHIPGGQSFMAELIGDAGGHYLWADTRGAGAFPFALESVYERAVKADFWLNPGLWASLDEIAGVDERFTLLKTFENRQVYGNDARRNTSGEETIGANDYWETGVLRPDLVLADLLRILHPDLAPDHELFFYRRY